MQKPDKHSCFGVRIGPPPHTPPPRENEKTTVVQGGEGRLTWESVKQKKKRTLMLFLTKKRPWPSFSLLGWCATDKCWWYFHCSISLKTRRFCNVNLFLISLIFFKIFIIILSFFYATKICIFAKVPFVVQMKQLAACGQCDARTLRCLFVEFCEGKYLTKFGVARRDSGFVSWMKPPPATACALRTSTSSPSEASMNSNSTHTHSQKIPCSNFLKGIVLVLTGVFILTVNGTLFCLSRPLTAAGQQ